MLVPKPRLRAGFERAKHSGAAELDWSNKHIELQLGAKHILDAYFPELLKFFKHELDLFEQFLAKLHADRGSRRRHGSTPGSDLGTAAGQEPDGD